MLDVRALAAAVIGYLRQHPEELLRVLRNALAMRFGIPIVALRWLAGSARSRKAPRDVEIDALPPGVRIAATVDLMGTLVRASGVVYVERVRLDASQLRFEIRLSSVALKVADGATETPIAALLRSGALDLSQPGNLVAYMPKRPPILVEAKGDRIVIDLMRHPRFAHGKRAERLLRVLAPFVTVAGIESDREHLDVALRPFPDGLREAISAVRRAI